MALTSQHHTAHVNGFARRKERNKAKIMDAAETLFNKYGIDKVNIEEIAGQAGVSKVTIYHLFGSKDGLIYSYFDNFVNSFIGYLDKLLCTDKPYIEKLEAIFQYVLKTQENHPRLYLESKNNPQLKELKGIMFERERKLVLELINEGRQRGYLNPDLSNEAIEAYIEVINAGLAENAELHDKMHHNKKMFHDLLLIMLYGFARIDNHIKT